jgi:hypothetical protein
MFSRPSSRTVLITAPLDDAASHSQERSRNMMLGMSLATFTVVHVAISLVAIAAGFVVLFGLLRAQRLDGWTALFLAASVLTSITGFMFPFEKITPGIILGVISLAVLAVTIPARYSFHLAGAWRGTYAIGATLALYLNVFVLVVQSFEKVPALHELAPTQSEPPFAITQLLVLLAFIVLGTLAARRFRKAAPPEAAAHAA